jgi:NADPH-dependent curcumin reductase CurA
VLARLLKEKKLKYAEDVVEGLENAPKVFIGLIRGENLGKQIVKVAVTGDNTVPPYGTGF